MNSILLKALSLFFLPVARVIGSQNRLILTNDCPCPGQNLTFECTIVGGGTTVWQGAQVFDCPDFFNEILLRHINFGSSVMGECNAGAIVGRSLRVDGNRYTSQLSVAYNESLNGKNITCAHDDGFTISSRISLVITQDSTVSFPSPSNVRLVNAAPDQLTFSWDPVAPYCAAIHYNILAQDCGICPSTTQHNTVVCHDMQAGRNLTCSFVVQNFRTCDVVAGNMSIPVNVMLKVPSAPTDSVVVIPRYSFSTREFVGLTVQFNQLDSFQISDDVDGSALFYSINFTNSLTGSSCGTATLPASSCVEGICTHMPSSFMCLPLPSGINVTVSGQNVLGKGADSHPITISTQINPFVDVDIMQALDRIVCTFHDQQINANREKTCRIVYGPMGSNCKTMSQSSHSFSDSVVLGLPLEDIEQEYCFSLTASSGPFTTIVEGTFLKDPNATTHQLISCSSDRVALEFLAPMIVLILLNVITAIIASIIIFMLVKSKRKIGLELERSRAKAKEPQDQHGLYEELDYVKMHTDSSKTMSISNNVSYSMITDQKEAHPQLSGAGSSQTKLI